MFIHKYLWSHTRLGSHNSANVSDQAVTPSFT